MERQYLRPEWSDDELLTAQQGVSDAACVLLLAPTAEAANTLMTILGDADVQVERASSLDDGVRLIESGSPPTVALITSDVSTEDSIDVLRAVAPPSLRIVVFDDEHNETTSTDADASLSLPARASDVVRTVRSQLRASIQIDSLETSRSTMLGTALLSMEFTQSLRTDLQTQQILHHEMLHRVQTHIGALRDYLELEVRRLPLGVAREAIRGVLYRVRNLSTLYETMATLAMEDPIEFGNLANKISQGVKAMYSPRSKLPVVVEGQLILPAASASPLTLIVNELITNAYRHAFPGGRFGTIRISCGRDDSHGWCMVVDDGVGIEVPTQTRPNSGMHLVRQLARRSLGGTCHWENSSPGTVAKVHFPLAAS